MWICQRSAYFKFIPSIHTHTHTHILIAFEDREPTGLKVDIAKYGRRREELTDLEGGRDCDSKKYSPKTTVPMQTALR